MMYHRAFIGLSVLLFLACAPAPSATDTSTDSTESTAASDLASSTGFQLKNMMINSDYVFTDGEHVRGTLMDATAIGKFKPSRIDEFYTEGDSYYFCDTVSTTGDGLVCFILKYDPNETTGWLVIYDRDMQVRDQIEAYYENAEGNFFLTSSILDNIVTASGENITPETDPVSAFEIVDGKWQIIEH